MAQQMGLGEIGGRDIVFKRKYRWTLAIDCCAGAIPEFQVKLASRPNLSIEETEINFLHGKMWIPGKGTWETITVTYYDLASRTGSVGVGNLYSWLANVYDFTDPINLFQSSKRGSVFGQGLGAQGYAGEATLTLYDGCGEGLERWLLGNCWPQAVNFGELDYSSSEEVTIEVTLRYSEAQWTNLCGPQPNKCGCSGC